jgi:hypothetical protein
MTTFLAKLLGLWVVIAVLSLSLNREASIATLNALFADPALLWVTGAFTTVIGLAIVLVHNRWSGGLLPVIVTIYGWLALLKGVLFLAFPEPAQADFFRAMRFDQYFYEYLAVALAIGAFFTYEGFKRSA